MSELLKKFNVKEQNTLFLWNKPEEFVSIQEEWSKNLNIVESPPEKPTDFLLVFVKDRQQLEESKPVIQRNMDLKGLIWIAYPKKTSKKYKSDIRRDDFWEGLKDLGLEPVRQIAIDDDWSALRFRPGDEIIRKKQQMKSI